MQPAHAFLALSLVFLLAPTAVRSQSMIIETDLGDTSLLACDMKHRSATCNYVHVDTTVALTLGASIQLSGQSYELEWMGPGYYLESGMVLQALGETRSGLKGQRWLEIYPHEGRVHTSRSWKDKDGNRLLNTSDALALDADREQTVKDVRLHLRLKPAPGRR